MKTATVREVMLCRPAESTDASDGHTASIFDVLSRYCSMTPPMKAAGSSDILVPSYHTTHRRILEVSNLPDFHVQNIAVASERILLASKNEKSR
jgi:hypothetical protein